MWEVILRVDPTENVLFLSAWSIWGQGAEATLICPAQYNVHSGTLKILLADVLPNFKRSVQRPCRHGRIATIL
jgi:hypothetical protein